MHRVLSELRAILTLLGFGVHRLDCATQRDRQGSRGRMLEHADERYRSAKDGSQPNADLHHHQRGDFGFIVDVPEIRALVDETRRLTKAIADHAARVEALRPAFATPR